VSTRQNVNIRVCVGAWTVTSDKGNVFYIKGFVKVLCVYRKWFQWGLLSKTHQGSNTFLLWVDCAHWPVNNSYTQCFSVLNTESNQLKEQASVLKTTRADGKLITYRIIYPYQKNCTKGHCQQSSSWILHCTFGLRVDDIRHVLSILRELFHAGVGRHPSTEKETATRCWVNTGWYRLGCVLDWWIFQPTNLSYY